MISSMGIHGKSKPNNKTAWSTCRKISHRNVFQHSKRTIKCWSPPLKHASSDSHPHSSNHVILNQSTEWCPIFRNQVLEICAGWSNQITDRSTLQDLKNKVTILFLHSKLKGMGDTTWSRILVNLHVCERRNKIQCKYSSLCIAIHSPQEKSEGGCLRFTINNHVQDHMTFPNCSTDPSQFNQFCKLLNWQISQELAIETIMEFCEWHLDICSILKVNRGNLHSVATKLHFIWSVLLSVNFQKFHVPKLSHANITYKEHIVVVFTYHISCWLQHWNGYNAWIIYVRNVIVNGNTQISFLDFWGERTTVHRLQILKCALVFLTTIVFTLQLNNLPKINMGTTTIFICTLSSIPLKYYNNITTKMNYLLKTSNLSFLGKLNSQEQF